MPITYQGPHVNTLTLTFSEHDIVAMFPVDFPRTILLKRYIACLTGINNQSDEELEAFVIITLLTIASGKNNRTYRRFNRSSSQGAQDDLSSILSI